MAMIRKNGVNGASKPCLLPTSKSGKGALGELQDLKMSRASDS
jgi:hypothetical protein